MPERFYLQGGNAKLLPIKGRGFLFDANVWISISGPFEDKIRARALAYSSLYKRIIEGGGSVVVPQMSTAEQNQASVAE
jgi:hypothetical protein